jgi:hypothetical protein
VTQIRAAPSAFAGRVDRYAPVGIAHQAKQPAFCVGAPACHTRSNWNMFWSRPRCFFLRLCHNGKHLAERSKLGYPPIACYAQPTCLFLFRRIIGIAICRGGVGLALILIEHIGCDQPVAAINI